MAIRGDNIPPGGQRPNTPGSITQNADANIDRIGNISNVSKTVANMQKDVQQRLTETKKAVDDSQSISAVQKSMTTVLDKLAGTVAALSTGVKTITVDTAKATKDAIGQYGKAVGEDISFNKQNVVAMALAKSTPIYGYFVAKFMETDVFKKAAERMKTSIGKAFGSLAGMFRRGKKGPGADTNIPKMQKGGYVKRGGLTELHAGEIVAPIEKILSRIDESITTTKDLVKITDKATMKMTGSFKGYMKSSTSTDKQNVGLLRSFIRTYKEVGEREFTERTDERMVRELISIRRAVGGQTYKWEQIWDEMIANHPYFRMSYLVAEKTWKGMSLPIKFMRAFMRVRGWGGYRAKLSKAKDPAHATAENIASLYVDLMWRLDSMIPLVKLTAQTNRDMASKITGNVYPSIKGVPKEKRTSIAKEAGKFLSAITGAGFISDAITGGMKEGGMAKKLLTADLFGGKKKTDEELAAGALPMGAPGGGVGTGFGLLVNEITLSRISDELIYYYKTQMDLMPIEIEYKKRRLEYLTWQETAMRQKIEQRNLENNVLQLGYEETSMTVDKLKKEKREQRKQLKIKR